MPAPVRAGSALVFSSLTPHTTGPNLTDAVRKAYILQYAPVGAQVLHGDPRAGAPTERVLVRSARPPVPDPEERQAGRDLTSGSAAHRLRSSGGLPIEQGNRRARDA